MEFGRWAASKRSLGQRKITPPHCLAQEANLEEGYATEPITMACPRGRDLEPRKEVCGGQQNVVC